jgi:chromosome segregation ATPase
MNIEDNFEYINLDEAFDSSDDEIKLENVRVQKAPVDQRIVESQLNSSKLTELEKRMEKVLNVLETGKKTHYLDALFAKYENVDPTFKQMLIEMNIASNEYTKENLKSIQGYFEEMKKEITTLKEESRSLSDYAANIHSDITTHRLVKKYLEKGFKKNTIKEEHVERAIEEHSKRLSKDEAYVLRLQNIWNTPGFDTNAKNRLTGELIFQNFRDVAAKAKGKKADEMPDLKKKVEKDERIEKDQKKMEKLQEKAQEEVKDTPKTDNAAIEKLINRIRRI